MKYLMQLIRRRQIQQGAMMTLPMLILMLLAGGCVTRIRDISPERRVVTMRAGVPYTPQVDGKFCPEAQWDDMLDVYIRHSYEK